MQSSTIRRHQPLFIWGITAIFALFQFSMQLSSGVIVNNLMESFSITAVGAGLLASMYFYIYTVLQIPAGILMDKYGVRNLLSVGAMVCCVGSFLFATTENYYVALLGRLMMGGGCAFAFVGMLHVTREWFKPERFAFMVGIAEMTGMFGTMTFSIFLAELVHRFGWRSSVMFAGVVVAIIGILCWKIIKKNPERIEQHAQSTLSSSDRFRLLFRNGKVWINGIYTCLIFSVLGVFVSLWGIPFIMKATDASLTMATTIDNFVFLGVAVGAPTIGFLDRLVPNRRLLLSSMPAISALLLTLVIYIPNLSLPIMGMFLFIVGFFSSVYILCFAISDEIAPKGAENAFMGLTNALCVVSAPLLQPLVGFLLHKSVSTFSATGHEIYQLHDFRVGLSVIPIALLCASFIALWQPQRKVKTRIDMRAEATT